MSLSFVEFMCQPRYIGWDTVNMRHYVTKSLQNHVVNTEEVKKIICCRFEKNFGKVLNDTLNMGVKS